MAVTPKLAGRPAILVFLKAPSVGQVKTRLIPALSPAQARELYRCLVLDTVDTIGRLRGVQPVAAYAGNAEFPDLSWLGSRGGVRGWPYVRQRGASLGERLVHACRWAFAAGASRVVVIGSDAPELSAAWLREAVESLDRCEAVIGPATDGGYHLIGFTKLHPALFHRMPWSTAALLDRTLARARQLRLRVHRLAPVSDLDTPDDLRRYLRRLGNRSGKRIAIRRTARYVSRLSRGMVMAARMH